MRPSELPRPKVRLGLAGTYRPGKEAIYHAVDNGVTVFFAYGFDSQTIRTLRDLCKSGRDKYRIVTGAYNLLLWQQDVRKVLEKRLRQFRTDYIDHYLLLGVTKPHHFPERIKEELHRLREEGKVRSIGISGHDRKFHGQLAADGAVDTVMMRYNAAHRGAEEDIFPHLAAHRPFVISYTATRWGYLLRRPKGYPKTDPLPTAPMCYRFVISNPNVDVVLSAPSNLRQLKENLAALDRGPLSDEEMTFMRRFGDVVHGQKKYFM